MSTIDDIRGLKVNGGKVVHLRAMKACEKRGEGSVVNIAAGYRLGGPVI